MPSIHVEEVILTEESDMFDVVLPGGQTISIYANGEVVIEADDYPYAEYSVNVVTKVKKANKREMKARAAALTRV